MFFLLLILSTNIFASDDFSVLSLNLHGYHPYNANERYSQAKKNGHLALAQSHLFYFSLLELESGKNRRDFYLAKSLDQMNPDIILFQELGAGDPRKDKNCDDFYMQNEFDVWENSAFKIKRNLKNYQIYLFCRGNIGWITTPQTFMDFRITDKSGNVVIDYGQNPYPKGVLIEGFGILSSPKIQVIKHWGEKLQINRLNDTFSVQWLLFKTYNDPKWFLLANVHAGHKILNFEQSVALRKAANRIQKSLNKDSTFGGFIFAGDFNAKLYRPKWQNYFSEVTTTVFEVKEDMQFDFNFTTSDAMTKIQNLKNSLKQLNYSNYKPWATISDPNILEIRINDSLNIFYQTQNELKDHLKMNEAISSNNCLKTKMWESSCFLNERIDFIFISGNYKAKESSILFSNNNWTTLGGFSDHPAIFARYGLPQK